MRLADRWLLAQVSGENNIQVFCMRTTLSANGVLEGFINKEEP